MSYLVGVVDIGTNSMRLLITDGAQEVGRWEEVTGLGSGVDRTGELSESAMADTMVALEAFGELMDRHEITSRKVIATAASRAASNREHFFDLAEGALGVRPMLITGDEEARFAYEGATSGFLGVAPPVVSDIGGGSTEFVTAGGGVSIDIGSVRITERVVPSRPAREAELVAARELLADLFSGVDVGAVGTLIGVAGTWVQLAALSRDLESIEEVHLQTISRVELHNVIERLSPLTVGETQKLPMVQDKRAPVILGGALIAEAVFEAVGVDQATISLHDSLDGVASELIGSL